MKRKRLIILVLFLMAFLGCKTLSLSADEVPRMTKEELKAMLGKPDLIIIDVRTDSDWAASDLKIKGAVREDPQTITSWANKYSKDKAVVLY